MKLSWKLAGALTASAVAFSANAADVDAQKTVTKLPDLVSSQSAKIQIRNYASQFNENERDTVSKTGVTTQARGYYTINTFNDKVATTLVLGVSQSADGNAKISQRRPRLRTEVTAIDNDYYSLAPYLDFHGPQTAAGTRGDLGLAQTLKIPAVKTSVGDFSASLTVEAHAQFESRESNTEVVENNNQTDRELGLLEKESSVEDTSNPESERYYMYTAPVTKWANVGNVDGLTLKLWAENEQFYVPVIKINEAGEKESSAKITRDTYTYLSASYAITESLTFTNHAWAGHGGWYQARGTESDRMAYGNIAMLSYKMF